MKKMIIALILFLVTCISLLAQGRVSTRKYRLADFPDKVTQVVLSGSEMLQGALRQAAVDKWTSSAFEFCTMEQFQQRMLDDRYYFLIVTENRYKGEEGPGTLFLSLLKGGKDKEEEGIGGLHEVIALPVQAGDGGTGRELVFMGALVKAVQDFTLAAMESEKVAYQGADWFNARYRREGRMKQLLLADEDLAPEVGNQQLMRFLDDDCRLVKAEEADAQYLAGTFNTLVSYTVSPLVPSTGSRSYVMLFEAETEELCYVASHKISGRRGAGITLDELKQIARRR